MQNIWLSDMTSLFSSYMLIMSDKAIITLNKTFHHKTGMIVFLVGIKEDNLSDK